MVLVTIVIAYIIYNQHKLMNVLLVTNLGTALGGVYCSDDERLIWIMNATLK